MPCIGAAKTPVRLLRRRSEMIERFEKFCDRCGRSEEEFEFCESRCMLQSCPSCTFLLQLYGTGCGNVHVYYLCRNCYDERIKRGYVEP